MSFDASNIYKLLPAVYRIRDNEHGKPLEAFIKIIAEQAVIVQENIGELYDDWFIETCKEWLVPYIGDLLGVRALNPIGEAAGVSQRAYVANTIAYRRRKGIAPVLEQLTLDVTGWRAHAVEFFDLMQTTQYMNHIRLHRPLTPDLRRMDELDRINTAFDTVAHSADVRHISSGRGKYNIPNLGIFAWRLQSYPLTRCDAAKVECIPSLSISPALSPTDVFTFNPTGKTTQLFNRPRTETAITHISTEINVPGLLRRRILFDELEALRDAFESGTDRNYNFFVEGSEERQPVFEVIRVDAGGNEEKILTEEITICNLEHCCTPPKIEFNELREDGTIVIRKVKALVDPVCGKLMFTEQDPNVKAIVSYSYGFSGDLGGGPYNRQNSIPLNFFVRRDTDLIWQAGVSKTLRAVQGEGIFKTIQEAIDEWHNQHMSPVGVITIMDSRTYDENLSIKIDEKRKLLIVAADWPVREKPVDGSPVRNAGDILAEDLRPFVLGDITIVGNGNSEEEETCGELILNGLLIKGEVSVQKGQLGKFTLAHSTIIPESGGLTIGKNVTNLLSNRWLTVAIDRCISGTIDLNGTAAVKLIVNDSILDAIQKPGNALSAVNTPVQLSCVTLFGATEVKTIEASNCIFNDPIIAKRRQEGCIRFSFVHTDSKAPRLYRCQPGQEITDQIAIETEEKGAALSNPVKTKIRNEIEAWMLPSFTSIVYDHRSYGQLSVTCPEQISNGADNGSEMGAFNFLKQPQRKANLQIALKEYLPLGLEAGVIYVT